MPKRRRRQYGNMPIGLQIYTFKKIFLKANIHFTDPYAEMDNIDWDILDTTISFRGNQKDLGGNYPQYHFSTSKKKAKERQKWKSKFDSKSNSRIYTTTVKVKPHSVKAKNKQYLHGRIQVTIDKKLIGQKARISIHIPNKNK